MTICALGKPVLSTDECMLCHTKRRLLPIMPIGYGGPALVHICQTCEHKVKRFVFYNQGADGDLFGFIELMDGQKVDANVLYPS